MEKCYKILNLDCANCAKKIEKEINKIEEIEKAILIFPMKKIKIEGNVNKNTEDKMQKICDKIEKGVIIQSEENVNNAKSEGLSGSLFMLIIGILFFIFAIYSKISLIYIIAYICLGYNVLFNTVVGIKNKNFFDENFLMTIATLGALILGDYSEAVGVVLFYKIGILFEKYAVNKSKKAISSIAELKIEEADVLINDEYKRISTDKIKIGDIIRIKNGERVAVDGIIQSGETHFDTSAINGESIPADFKSGDYVMSGYINLSNVVTIKATASVENSMMSKIVNAIENASSSKPKIDKLITRFSKIYTPIIIVLAFLTATIPSLITGNWHYWIYTALTFLIISCPCAVVLSVPLAYFSGIGTASKIGVLLKNGNSIEALSKIKNIVFDKTGTITNGNFSVCDIIPYKDNTKDELLEIAAMCESNSNHPIAVSISRYCDGINYKKTDKIKEITGKGIIAEKDNQVFLCGNIKLMCENNIAGVECDNEKGCVIYVAKNNEYIGKILVSDTIKSDAGEAINKLKNLKLNVVMLTGDKKEAAEDIAGKLGITSFKSELLPEQKLQELNDIRIKSGASAFVGDGVNDGIVLAGADVGISIHNGSDLAIEASDIILMNNNLNLIAAAKKIADKTTSIAKQNIIFALIIKAIVLVLGFMGVANMWFAVFADSGVAILLALNSIRLLRGKQFR